MPNGVQSKEAKLVWSHKTRAEVQNGKILRDAVVYATSSHDLVFISLSTQEVLAKYTTHHDLKYFVTQNWLIAGSHTAIYTFCANTFKQVRVIEGQLICSNRAGTLFATASPMFCDDPLKILRLEKDGSFTVVASAPVSPGFLSSNYLSGCFVPEQGLVIGGIGMLLWKQGSGKLVYDWLPHLKHRLSVNISETEPADLEGFPFSNETDWVTAEEDYWLKTLYSIIYDSRPNQGKRILQQHFCFECKRGLDEEQLYCRSCYSSVAAQTDNWPAKFVTWAQMNRK